MIRLLSLSEALFIVADEQARCTQLVCYLAASIIFIIVIVA